MSSNAMQTLDNQSFYGIRFFEFRRVASMTGDDLDWTDVETNPSIPDQIDYGRLGSHRRSEVLIKIEAMLRIIAQIL